MSNSILNSMGAFGNNNVSNFLSHINEFNNFKNSFNGNPQQQVQNLIKNGQLSQEQFNQYAQLANLIRPLIK